MIKAFVFGESHTHCIAQALRRHRNNSEIIEVHRMQSRNRPLENGMISLEEAIERITALPEDVPIFLSMLGTYHNIFGLLGHDFDYDFLVNSGDHPSDGCPFIIPNRVITDLFEKHFDKSGSVKKLRRAARSEVYLLGTAPPKQSNEFIMTKFMSKTNKVYHGNNVALSGLNRPDLRLKLWQMEVNRLREWAISESMHFIPPPVEGFNEDGFLSRKYYANDATHANAAYGELVLQQIISVIDNTAIKE
jgi:hypothetical protein